MRRRNSLIARVLMIICCILLAAGLAAFLLWYRRTEQEYMKQIQEETMEATSVENSGDGTGDIEPTPESSVPGTTLQTDIQSMESDVTEGTEANSGSAVEGISFRGDSFCDQEDIQDSGFGFYMTELLKDKGIDIPVQDYTMSEAGSMSHMKLAGVSQQVLDTYLTEHQEIAEEKTLRITEVKIRDLTEEEMARDDQNYIPVICAGYYGGWLGDPEELCDQIQQILDTYQQKEKYLILGVYPNSYSEKESYRDFMSTHWGEHYMHVDGQIVHSISTDEGKKEVSQMVYDKFVELGYIDHE